MSSTLSNKMGIKPTMRAILVDTPVELLPALGEALPGIEEKLSGEFDFIHFFVRDQKAFHHKFTTLMQHLSATGMLWVSWPKAGQLETDLTIQTVIKIGYDYGLVESKCISVNTTWSALKFTWPKKDKTYNNSYGKLR